MVGEKVAAGRRGAPHLTLTHTGPGGRAAFAGLALAYGALFVFDAADGGGRGHWLSWVLPFRLGIASWALLVVAAEGTLPVARAWWRELRALACVAMVVFEAVGVGFAAHLDGEAPGGPGRHNADLVVIVLVVAALAACRHQPRRLRQSRRGEFHIRGDSLFFQFRCLGRIGFHRRRRQRQGSARTIGWTQGQRLSPIPPAFRQQPAFFA